MAELQKSIQKRWLLETGVANAYISHISVLKFQVECSSHLILSIQQEVELKQLLNHDRKA